MRLLATLCALPLLACDGEPEPFIGDPDYARDPALDIPLHSAHAGATSHGVGENCMSCHQPHGPGPGLFSAAGTLYDQGGEPLPGGVVELRTGGDGQGDLVVRLEVDGLGNFYTTEPLALTERPLFPTVYGPDGVGRNHMPFPTRSGACNVCHVGGFVVRVPEA
jgi:hypothetical protein